jgi:hypothetical protein
MPPVSARAVPTKKPTIWPWHRPKWRAFLVAAECCGVQRADLARPALRDTA